MALSQSPAWRAALSAALNEIVSAATPAASISSSSASAWAYSPARLQPAIALLYAYVVGVVAAAARIAPRSSTHSRQRPAREHAVTAELYASRSGASSDGSSLRRVRASCHAPEEAAAESASRVAFESRRNSVVRRAVPTWC